MNSLVQPPNLGSATGYLHPLSEQLFPNTEEKKKSKKKAQRVLQRAGEGVLEAEGKKKGSQQEVDMGIRDGSPLPDLHFPLPTSVHLTPFSRLGGISVTAFPAQQILPLLSWI